jgi:hypothetical protein
MDSVLSSTLSIDKLLLAEIIKELLDISVKIIEVQ